MHADLFSELVAVSDCASRLNPYMKLMQSQVCIMRNEFDDAEKVLAVVSVSVRTI